jgi:integrase
MPRLAVSLVDLQIRKAAPKDKPYFLSDGNGLVLWISPAGLKSWRVRYRLPDGSRPAPATIGHYPGMSLAEARVKSVAVQRDAKQGKSTAGIRKNQQAIAAADAAQQETVAVRDAELEHASFRSTSTRWMAEKRPGWAAETYRKARLVVDSYLLLRLGALDMRLMETKDVRPVLVEMAREKPQLARKARQYIASIVDHAINEGLRPDDSRLRLERILPAYRSGHMPAVTDNDEKLGDVMRAIDGHANRVVRAALILAALTVMRSGVVASAKWAEIDFEMEEWRVPGKNPDGSNRMKTGQDFSTSLPAQALAVLREMHERNMGGEYVFPPQSRQNSPHVSRDALSKALREMGFQGEHTTHGFRASLRTLGRERLSVDVDVLEAQLAHAPKDEIQAAYARVKFRTQRRTLMQQWADYLDELKRHTGQHRAASNAVPEVVANLSNITTVEPLAPLVASGSVSESVSAYFQNVPLRLKPWRAQAAVQKVPASTPPINLVEKDSKPGVIESLVMDVINDKSPRRKPWLRRDLPKTK